MTELETILFWAYLDIGFSSKEAMIAATHAARKILSHD